MLNQFVFLFKNTTASISSKQPETTDSHDQDTSSLLDSGLHSDLSHSTPKPVNKNYSTFSESGTHWYSVQNCVPG